jgi:hypothetical protein
MDTRSRDEWKRRRFDCGYAPRSGGERTRGEVNQMWRCAVLAGWERNEFR